MMQTVQFSIADGRYADAVREALTRNCAWQVDSRPVPDLSQESVVVLDEATFARLPLPLTNPERVVLVTRKDPETMAEAWEAGIVSVVSDSDPISTVLLAIMAAALRVAKSSSSSGISPNENPVSAPLPPQNRTQAAKRSKFQ
jgi:hypothetical protein